MTMRPRFQVGIRTCSLMGDFGDPLPRSLMTSLPRQCVRCGCALRYGNTETRCAPCAEALRPAFPVSDTPSYRERTACPLCGCPKKPASKLCITCSNKTRHQPATGGALDTPPDSP